MIDLSSQEMQSTFKKLQRTTLVTNVTMCIVTVLAAAIAIWGTSTANGKASWSETMFYVLIAVLAVYFAAVLVWEIVLRRKNAAAMHAFIAEGFFANGAILKDGGEIAFETSLAGDKLAVMRNDGGYIQFDLAPIKNYSSVCAYTVRLAKKFVCDYYSLTAQRSGVESVILTDKVRGRGKKYVYVKESRPKSDRRYSYFIRHGIIK